MKNFAVTLILSLSSLSLASTIACGMGRDGNGSQVRSEIAYRGPHQSFGLIADTKNLVFAAGRSLLNPSLTTSFLSGKRIFSKIPHVRSSNPLGHLHFTRQAADQFSSAALKTPNGLATFWAGPFPVLYVINNDTRLALVRQSHMGVIDEPSWEYVDWLSGGNNVMSTFPDFRPIGSASYKAQREFLIKRFHGGARYRLAGIEASTKAFLKNYQIKYGQNPRSLREFITALVLHTSSSLLGLTQKTLDELYIEKPEYHDAIRKVAHYGISDRADFSFEKKLYEFFLEVLQGNFEQIHSESPESNLIRNIFESLDVKFPGSYDEFFNLSAQLRHTIAMNFASTGLGAMVHSTATTLDWAIARLLQEQRKLEELTQLMASVKGQNLDLSQQSHFDKKGQLAPIGEWVLHNVFLYPPFSHEFFLNRKSFTAELPDGSKITVPANSFIIVNYTECNRSNRDMVDPETFSKSLSDTDTLGRFIMDKRVASFGGSLVNKHNTKSRICPAAKTSLYEQMIIIATLLRDYTLELTNENEFSCEADRREHPLCSRLNQGDIILEVNQIDHSKATKSSPLQSELE